MAFRIGQCYYKGKQFTKASAAFDKFAKVFPDDALCGDAMFWSGESFRTANNTKEASAGYNQPVPLEASVQRGRQVRPRSPGIAGNAAAVRGRSDHRRMIPIAA